MKRHVRGDALNGTLRPCGTRCQGLVSTPSAPPADSPGCQKRRRRARRCRRRCRRTPPP